MQEHCGVPLSGMGQIYERAQRAVHLQEEGRTEEEVKAIMYDERKRVLIDQWRAEGKTDAQIADMMYVEELSERSMQAEVTLHENIWETQRRLDERSNQGGDEAARLHRMYMLEDLLKNVYAVKKDNPEYVAYREYCFSNPAEAQIYTRKQNLYKSVVSEPKDHAAMKKRINSDGKEEWVKRYPNTRQYRDVISNLSSLENPGDCGMQKAIRYLDNSLIIEEREKSVVAMDEYEKAQAEIEEQLRNHEIEEKDKEARLEERKKQRYDERRALAIEEEMKLQRDARKEIEDYLSAKNLLELEPFPSMETLKEYVKLTRCVFEKEQGISIRVDMAFKKKVVHELPAEKQEEFVEFFAFHTAVCGYVGNILLQFKDRASGKTAHELVPLESLIDEFRDRARRHLEPTEPNSNAAASS